MKASPMQHGVPSLLRRAAGPLRRPVVIVTVVVGLAVAAALAATLPQEPDLDDVGAFARGWPLVARVTVPLGLHRIVTSWWFLALVALAFASLLVVQVEQWRRLARLWGEPLTPSSFQRAQLRREAPVAACPRAPAAPRFRRDGRAGMLGSPIFHLGLVVVMAAGLVRLLTFREALVRVVEGQTLAAEPGIWAAERGGLLSSPLALPAPVRFDEIRATRYTSGALRQLGAGVTVTGGPTPGPAELAINAPLDVGAVRLYIGNAHGVAALLVHRTDAGEAPLVAYLEGEGSHARSRLRLPDGSELRLRALRSGDALRGVELRAVRGDALVGVYALGPGAEVAIPGAGTVRLVGLPGWAQLRGTRDASRPLFFAGLVIGLAGVGLMFSFVRVDSGVFVQGDRLVVAMRVQRFAPLFTEKFERLATEWMR